MYKRHLFNRNSVTPATIESKDFEFVSVASADFNPGKEFLITMPPGITANLRVKTALGNIVTVPFYPGDNVRSCIVVYKDENYTVDEFLVNY